MKKKNVMLIGALSAALVLFSATAFAALKTGDGYEAFKNLMENKQELKNATLDFDVTLIDNDEVIFSSTGTVKGNKFEGEEAASGHVAVTMNGESQEIMFYGSRESEEVVIKDLVDGQLYLMKSSDDEEFDDKYDDYRDRDKDHVMSEQQELLFDTLVGDYKNDFSLVENEDGTNTILFDLSGEEIPEVLDIMASVAMSEKHKEGFEGREEMMPEGFEDYPLFNRLNMEDFEHPQLTENVDISQIYVAIDVDENDTIIGLKTSFEVAGNDEDGVYHELKFTANVAISNIGETVVDTIDTTDEEVIVIECEGHDRMDCQAKMERGRR